MDLDIPELLETEIAGNVLTLWAIAAVTAVVIINALLLVRGFLGQRLSHTGASDQFSWRLLVRDFVYRTSTLFILILGLYLSSLLLKLPASVNTIITSISIVVLFIQAAIWADRLVGVTMQRQLGRHAGGSIRNALSLIQLMGRVAVWSIALLLMLSNLGVDVTALVAGLGIGGVAVALAAQSVLSDLFASLAIVLDKPFEIGDFIVFGTDCAGTVEKIGIKTTRIRALSGEQLVCANNDLLNSRIRNYKRMQERRVAFTVGVTYETPRDRLARVADMLKQIVEEQQDKTRFDRAHLKQFGDSTIVYEVVHWVLSADFNFYMDVQQTINLAILERFAAEGIDFAYPTRTIHMYEAPKGEDGGGSAGS